MNKEEKPVFLNLFLHSYAPFGQSFFSPDLGRRQPLGDGLESWRGFYQSIRPTQMGLSLNIGNIKPDPLGTKFVHVFCLSLLLHGLGHGFFFPFEANALEHSLTDWFLPILNTDILIFSNFCTFSDMSATAFIEPLPVIEFVAQLLNSDIHSRPLSDAERVKVFSLN